VGREFRGVPMASQTIGHAVEYKYWAFISYSHADDSWGRWLHQALETYRLPRSLVGKPSRDGIVPRRLLPIFRDREELPISADLGANLKNVLESSRYLIVICSPSAAKSRWVNEEIRFFKSSRTEERVLCFIVAGEPNAADKPHFQQEECLPDSVRFRIGVDGTLTDVRTEPLAADARKQGDGKTNAKLKTIAGLAGVNFDDLKHRERRRRFWQRVRLGSLIAALTAFIIVLVQVEEKRMNDQKTNEEIQKYAEAGQDRLDNGRYLQAAVFFAAAYRLQEGVSAMTEQLQKGLIECSKAALAKQILIMNGHADWVTSAAFSNDGQHLVTASWDKTIRLWNLNTGASKVIAQSVGKMASVNLSPDGTRIVGGCWDGYAYVWELDGKLLATLDGHRGRVVYAAFSPDGKRIVTASEDATAREWSTDGKPLFIIKGHTDSVKSAVYSPDGSSILTAGFDGTAKIWDSSSGQLLRTIDAAKEGQKSLNFAAFSPDGKRIATVGLSPEVIIWDLDGQRVGRLSAHAKRINYVQFDHSGTLLVTASDEDNVKVWDLPHGQLSMSLDRHKGNLALSAVFNPDDSRLVTTGSDHTARLWDARLRKENFSELVTTIEKESPWKIVGGQIKEQ
jgi:hypothetical protein